MRKMKTIALEYKNFGIGNSDCGLFSHRQIRNPESEIRNLFRLWTALAVALCALFVSRPAFADYEFRFVPADDPDGDIAQRVQTDSLEYLLYPYQLTEGQRESYFGPRDAWVLNMMLDGKPLFEVYTAKGNVLARLPIARRDTLKTGKHVIWPGDHQFTIAEDGSVSSDDPEFLISKEQVKNEETGEPFDRHVIKLRAYQLKISAKNADEAAPKPREYIEEIPLPNMTLRDATQQEQVEFGNGKVRELIPNPGRSLFLRCWVPAVTNGQGYRLFPFPHTFLVTPEGVKPGEGPAVPGWYAEGHDVTIPITRVLAQGPEESQMLISGMQIISFSKNSKEDHANLYNRKEPYEFRVSNKGPSLFFDGDLSILPNKLLRVDWSGPEQLHQRGALFEAETRHLRPGQGLATRIRAFDTQPANLASAAATNAINKIKSLQGRVGSDKAAVTTAEQGVTAAKKRVVSARGPAQAVVDKRDAVRNRINETIKGIAEGKQAKTRADKAAAEWTSAEAAAKAAREAVTAAQPALDEAKRIGSASEAEIVRATEDINVEREREPVEQAAIDKATQQLEAAKTAEDAAAAATAQTALNAAKTKLDATQAAIRTAMRMTDAASARAKTEQEAIRKAEEVVKAAQAKSKSAVAKADAADQRHVEETAEADAVNLPGLEQTLVAAKAGLPPLEEAVKKEEAKIAAVVAESSKGVQAAKQVLAKAKQKLIASEKAVKQGQAEAHRKHKHFEKEATTNPLASMTPYARLQAYRGTDWVRLPLEPGEEGRGTFSIPDTMKPGVYKLRLGITPTDSTVPPLFADQWVTMAGDEDVGVGLFTRRGRNAFYRGELFWIGMGVRSVKGPVPAGTEVSIEMKDEFGGSISLMRDSIDAAIEDRRTFLVQLDAEMTLRLAPGRYQAVPRVGDTVGPAFVMEIIDPAPRTHFLNLLIGKYNNYGFAYSSLIGSGNAVGARSRNLGLYPQRSTASADDIVKGIVESGYNAFKGMCYGMGRVSFPDSTTIANIVRERPELGPWEAFAPASGRDRFLNACVKHNLEFYENLFTQHDSMMPRGDYWLQACERYTTMETASMRHQPAFKGVCLYDEFSQSLDHDTPDVVMADFHKADERNYRRKYGGRTSSQAKRALDRFTARPPEQRDYDDVEVYRTWPDHLADQWAEFSSRMANAAKLAMPESRNFTLARIGALPGENIGEAMYWPTTFKDLDIASTVGYKDMGGWGDFPLSGPIMADILRTRPGLTVAPMIYGLQSGPYGDSNLRHAFFTLSQNVDGISFMQFESNPPSIDPYDNYDSVRDIAGNLTTRYGDFFLACERGYGKVAIFYSRDADVLSPRKPLSVRKACEGLWAACAGAGYPADFLTDLQVQADEGMDYEVIFAPGWYIEKEMPPATKAAMTRLISAGKHVIVERDSRIGDDIGNFVRLDTNLDEVEDRVGGSFPKFLDFDNERWWDMTVQTRAMVRSVLSGLGVDPAAEHDILVGPDWLKCRDAEYLVVANHAFTGFTGNHKLLFQAPDSPQLRFPKRPPVCYDMLEMKRVDVAADEDWMTLTADMRHVPGKIYAFLPAEIDRVVLSTPARAKAGANLDFEVSVADGSGKTINAGIPYELIIRSADQRILRHVYRAAAPKHRDVYTVPANLPGSTIEFHVRELISGREVKVEVPVDGVKLSPASLVTRDVHVTDAARIRAVIENAPSDVPFHFEAKDLVNVRKLVLRLKKGGDPLSRYLRDERFSPETKAMVETFSKRSEVKDELRDALLTELNKVVDGDRLFEPRLFPPGVMRIETGRLAEETSDPARIRDINRLLLEENYWADGIRRREPLYVCTDQPWLVPQAERLLKWLNGMGVRTRVTRTDPWLRAPGTLFGEGMAEVIGQDGSRLWRGWPVAPSVYLDAPVIMLGSRVGLMTRLIERDLLSDPVSDNFPGEGKAVLGWVPKAFAMHHDAITILCTDEKGLERGIDALLQTDALEDNLLARSHVARPEIDASAQLVEHSGQSTQPTSFRAMLSHEDRVTIMDVDTATGRTAVGTFGYGNNLFCFSAEGALQWKTFLPEHEVYYVRWIDGGKKLLAATAHGWRVFLIDAANGSVIRKFSSTEWPNFHVGEREWATRMKIVLNPKMRQVLVKGKSGIMAVDYDGNKMWFLDRFVDIISYPSDAVQTSFASFGNYLTMLDIVPSPDGTKLAYNDYRYIASTMGFAGIIPLYRNEPQVLDAKTGKTLLLNTTADPAANVRWGVSWNPDGKHIWIDAGNLSAPLYDGKKGPDGVFQGELGEYIPPSGETLSTGGTYEKDFHFVERFDDAGSTTWDYIDKTDFFLVDLDILNAQHTRLYRSGQNGWVTCVDLNTGKKLWQHKMPMLSTLHVSSGDILTAGARNGKVVRFDPSGTVVWETMLREHNEVPDGRYVDYLRGAIDRDPDATAEFFALSRERPDDLKNVLRMGIEQLDNGGLEKADGWQISTGTVTLVGGAKDGAKALELADGQQVTTRVNRKVIARATYLLEFYYKIENPNGDLTAGAVMSGGDEPAFTLSRFSKHSDDWTFGRLAIKTYADTKSIDVGFEAGGDTVLVDSVSLRPIRFPSANLVANDALHRVQPSHPKDFRDQYNRISHQLREDLMGESHARALMQATPLGALVFLEEHSFLHNGRLDDIGKMWSYRPNPIGFTIVLDEETWVSHMVIYLNNAAPDMTYQQISIVANDCELEPSAPATVGHVRGNQRRFCVVKFDRPVLTDNIKVLPGHYRTWRDSVTELEVYGPVGGPESLAKRGFAEDPNAVAMFMGTPSHVPVLPADLVGTYQKGPGAHKHYGPAVNMGVTVVDSLMTFGLAAGRVKLGGETQPESPIVQPLPVSPDGKKRFDAARTLATKEDRKPFGGWHVGSITPLGTPTRYASRLIVGAADYKVHAVSDNGRSIWKFDTGGRVYSSPVPDKDEIFIGSDDGRVYKLDIDSGMLIWEFITDGAVRSSPVLDARNVYFASWDGHVYAVDRRLGTQRWKTPIGTFSSASPALDKGKLYIGDEDGNLYAINAANGKILKTHKLEDSFSRCPVVTPDGIAFVGDSGKAVFLGADFAVRWTKDLLQPLRSGSTPARLTGQPFATQTQLVLTSNRGLLVLKRADGSPDTRFVPPRKDGNFVSAVAYGNRLCMVENKTAVHGDPKENWIISNQSGAEVWEPKP
jgi:outer membrane protein assembly factor BamB